MSFFFVNAVEAEQSSMIYYVGSPIKHGRTLASNCGVSHRGQEGRPRSPSRSRDTADRSYYAVRSGIGPRCVERTPGRGLPADPR